MHLPYSAGMGGHLVLSPGEIVAECGKRSFTGILVLSVSSSRGTVLFRCGKPACVSYGGLTGTAALKRIEAGEGVAQGVCYPCSLSDLDAVLPLNTMWQTDPIAAASVRVSTTARPVRVGGQTSSARVRAVRTFDTGGKTVGRTEEKVPDPEAHQRKEVLNSAAVQALMNIKDDFQKDASNLLKEMNMEHLLTGEEKEPQ